MIDTDYNIIGRVLGGDRDAFAVLVNRYKDRMYAIAMAKVHDTTVMEDIVQQAFTEAFSRLDTLRDREKFGAWLARITTDLCHQHFHTQDRYSRDTTVFLYEAPHRAQMDIPTPELIYETQEMQTRVLDALEDLSPQFREVIMLRYMEDMPLQGIADLLDIPRTTVEGRLRLAKQHLHQTLTPLVEDVLKGFRPDESFPRRIMAVTTVAGGSEAGYHNGLDLTAQLDNPVDIARDTTGNLYVIEFHRCWIRKIDRFGCVAGFIGSGIQGYADGPAGRARFNGPSAIAIDPAGHIYIGDQHNNRIRKITPDGTVSTLAGDGIQGYKDGPGHAAQFDRPTDLIVASDGSLIVLDTANSLLRRIDASGYVSTIAGTLGGGFTDGPALSARFSIPRGFTMDQDGTIFIADTFNHCIRKLDRFGRVSTIAGSLNQGFVDGPGETAKFVAPYGIDAGSDGTLYVTDCCRRNVVPGPVTIGNHAIRRITRRNNGYHVETIAGTGTRGFSDGPAISAQLHHPAGIIVDDSGDITFADCWNDRIRRISHSLQSG